MKRVLLIDDAKAVISALHAALDPFGLEVDHADSGPAGLQKILSSKWDLVFLDIEMPVMDGSTVLRIVRSRGVTTPIVLVTGVSSTSVLAAAIRLGAAHYISKPFTATEVRAATAKILRLDLPRLDGPPPRVLVLAPDRTLAGELTKLLPANVAVDTAETLNQLVDTIGQRLPGVVLLHGQAAGAPEEIAAATARAFAPTAGVFRVRDGVCDTVWAPQGDIDGVLPRARMATLVHELLYPCFLRQLVFVEGAKARAAAFQGEPQYVDAYFASLTRHLVARGNSLACVENLSVDLAQAPPEPSLLVPLIATVSAALTTDGSGPWFALSPAVAAVKSHPDLREALFL